MERKYLPLIADSAVEFGEKYDVDPALIVAIIRQESQGKPTAKSKKGAVGLMQLMPETAKAVGVRKRTDPRQNIEGGTRFLRDLLNMYDEDLPKVLAAYNAGPTRIERSIPPETQSYVARILRDLEISKEAQNILERRRLELERRPFLR